MSRTSRRPGGPFVLIVFAAFCVMVAPAARAGHLLGDGVVLDAGAGVVYAMSPAGGIDAIDLGSGEVRWSSVAAAKPLHLTDGLLIAQVERAARGAVDLAALSAESGARRHGMTVALPPDVWAGVDDGPDRSFRCHVGGGVSDLAVSWRESRPVDNRFAIPAPALDESSGPVIAPATAGGSRTGAASLDLVAGAMTPLSAREIPVPLAAPSHHVGVYLAAVEGRQRLSADGNHVLASVRTGEPGEWLKYRWSVYTRSGERVGSISHHLASAPFTVAGTTLVYRDQPYTLVVDGAPSSEPLTLRGVDLASGAEIWARAIRETAYQGPFVP